MARVITAKELAELALKQLGDGKGPSDLARALGMTSYSAPRTVSRWLEGENEPSYEATLGLLEMVGLLRPLEGAERGREAAQYVLPDDLAEAVAALSAKTEELRASIQRLQKPVSEATRLSDQVVRSRARGRRG